MNKPTSPKHTPVPNRPLSRDFTDYTMRHARTAQRRFRRWHGLHIWFSAPNNRGSFTMKLAHKPLFAALAVIVVIGLGGTTYAAVNGGLSSITALFGSETKLQSSRIVRVDLQNCHDRNAFNIVSGTGAGNTPRYYLVKDSANLSNDKVVSLAQSICRAVYESPAAVASDSTVSNRPENKDKLIGNALGTITAITPTTIDIKVSGNVTSNRQPYVEHFTNIDSNLEVVDSAGQVRDYGSLKVGDVVYSSYRSLPDGQYETERTALNNVDWSKQVLVTVHAESTDEANIDMFNTLVQKKLIEQVAPCKTTSSGYCTFEQLQAK